MSPSGAPPRSAGWGATSPLLTVVRLLTLLMDVVDRFLLQVTFAGLFVEDALPLSDVE